MEMRQEEDEEFIVIKAGPPLPIRRPRKSLPTTFSDVYPSPSPIILAPKMSLSHNNDYFNPRATLSRIPTPTPRPPSPASSIQVTNTNKEPVLSNKSTIQKGQTSSPGQKSPRRKPRPVTPTIQVESKVRQYIEQVKKSDEINRLNRVKPPEKFLSLEDLYQVTLDLPSEDEKYEEIVQDKLRQTLRILKEKDEMINKLRESCHDLKLKWADAENRVDEMRFGIGGNGRSSCSTKGQGQINYSAGHGVMPKRSISEINLCTKENNKVMKDQETETEKVLDRVRDNKSRKTPTTEDDLNDFDLDDRQSDFDPVLDEKCSNWLEKVQNWQTDSSNNQSQDSCGDRDSGFRGSAELEGHPNQMTSTTTSRKHRSSRTPKTKSKSKSSRTNNKDPSFKTSLEEEEGPTLTGSSSKSLTPDRTLTSGAQGHNILHFQQYHPHAVTGSPSLTIDSQEQSSPSSLQTAQPWHTFVSNLNPQSTTEYQGFPSTSSPKNYFNYELSGTKSMGALDLFASKYPERNPEDYGQLLRDLDKRSRTLNPLLDDATEIALRVKIKSERLAKILKDKNNPSQ